MSRTPKTGKEMMNELSDFFNNFTADEEGFVEAFKVEHRTLQQNILRAFFAIMVETAERGQRFADPRNEASVKACEVMVKAYEKEFGFKPNVALPHI